ncbi:hypothetical protein RX330_10660 [Bradyrhizobium sp. NDS-1]|uniref:hypothetical protein n=1 Tax=Bradyrhizobium sp. NDS-1 TaxID=3080014 RepID=UPI00293F285D|nr:hypothetical protein [Bradyrhizobium sp. NDS-1]WOH75526.1 hypothetical protein RX330_10660 [Bradyrhizobium sp. NDS-1]
MMESREGLLHALEDEAKRVGRERAEAAGEGKKSPHSDRAIACDAFLTLPEETKATLLARARIRPKQPNISAIEDVLADSLTMVMRDKRARVARQLLKWWNGQVLDLLTKKRQFGIS